MIGYSLRFGNMDLQDTRTRQYVGVGFMAIWVLALVFLGMVPAIRGAFVSQQLMESEKLTDTALTANVEKIRLVNGLLSTAKENVSFVNQAVPTTKKEVTLINEIDLLAAKHNLVIKNLSLSGAGVEGASGELVSLGFVLEAVGDYPSIRNFIFDIEQLPRIIQLGTVDIGRMVETVQVGGIEEEVASSVLTVSISGNFYYSPLVTGAVVGTAESGE